MRQNTVERDRLQITIWRMRIACWIPNATNTHSEYVIRIAFPLQQWLHERASLLRYSTLSAMLKTLRLVCGLPSTLFACITVSAHSRNVSLSLISYLPRHTRFVRVYSGLKCPQRKQWWRKEVRWPGRPSGCTTTWNVASRKYDPHTVYRVTCYACCGTVST